MHLAIFDILDTLVTDGTHDQLRPIRRLIDAGHTRYWSYDLSSATDRLPVSLQALLLDYLLGETRSGRSGGEVWRDLLVGREYGLPAKACKVLRAAAPTHVQYSVGQPMGALSSWAMLALVHHFLVQCSAHRVGHRMGKFSAYAVLGDDIVIADGRVARSYRGLMLELGVGISAAKSLVSRQGTLEFAKRYFHRGVDCSPISLKELGSAIFSGTAMLEFGRKYGLEFSRVPSV